MSQTYDCYITKDINKKPGRKNWLSGTLVYNNNEAQIALKTEEGRIVAEIFDHQLFSNFMDGNIIKVRGYEAEFVQSSNNNFNNNNNRNNNINDNNNNFYSKPRKYKFKKINAPKVDLLKMNSRNKHSFRNNNNYNNNNKYNQNNQYKIEYKQNNVSLAGGPLTSLPKNVANALPFTMEPPKRWNKNRNQINRNNNNRKRSFNQFNNDNKNNINDNKSNDITVTTQTEKTFKGSILDYIEIDKKALDCNDNEIYVNNNTKSLENILKNNDKYNDIPDYFRRPYFLPFYNNLPKHVKTQINDNVTGNDNTKIDLLKKPSAINVNNNLNSIYSKQELD